MIKPVFETFFKFFLVLETKLEMIRAIIILCVNTVEFQTTLVNVEYLNVFEIQETASKKYFSSFLNPIAIWQH